MTALTGKSRATIPLSPTLILAWAVMLLVSTLPNILWREITGAPAGWLFWTKEGLLVALLLLSIPWQELRPLRQFMAIIAILFAAEQGFHWASSTMWWIGWVGAAEGPFVQIMWATQVQRLCVTLILIVALLVIKRRPDKIFLTAGNLRAKAGRVRWLGIDEGESWMRVGAFASIFISVGLLIFLVSAGWSTLGALPQAISLLPVLLLFAAMNAFSEEVSYRSSLISTSEDAVGSRQAIWLVAVFFGIGHFYGVPYGVIGVFMAGFLGWFLGKAMVETRGLFWPWFIHFVQDVLIFSFMAVGSVMAGGG
ncbi:MAG: CPBP family intramembrane metalloprotease [Caldilineaceae bacterium]|nr:CPBP family intramembrane metalloprotease [Caldilineaceae bacterium]